MENLEPIIAKLKAERGLLSTAIAALEALSGKALPLPTSRPTVEKVPTKRVMSPEARKRIGDATRKRWQPRKPQRRELPRKLQHKEREP
jgi:hypothetical protein